MFSGVSRFWREKFACYCKEWYTVSAGRGASLLIKPQRSIKGLLRDEGGERLLNEPTMQKHFKDKRR